MNEETTSGIRGCLGFGVILAALVAIALLDLWNPMRIPATEAIAENHGTDSVWYWRALPARWQESTQLVWQKVPTTNDPHKSLKLIVGDRETIVRVSNVINGDYYSMKDTPIYNGDLVFERSSFPVAKWTISLAKPRNFKEEWYPPDRPVVNPAFLRDRDQLEARGNKLVLATPSMGQTKMSILPGEVLQIGEEGSWQIFFRRTGVYDTDAWEIAVPP